jgi:hypothetical protein
MSKGGTIEINHSNFLVKLDTVGNAIEILKKYDMSAINIVICDKFKYIINIYDNMKDSYEMEVVDMLSEYYDNDSESDPFIKNNKNTIADIYGMYITSCNYNGKLSQCMTFIETIHQHIKNKSSGPKKKGESKTEDKKNVSELTVLIKKFKRSKISTSMSEIKYDACVCGTKMKIFPNTSELVCPTCGKVLILYGTVFEDTQFYNQEGQRSKHGCYDPSRHCKFWVHRIQAKENADIPKTCIDQLIYCIKRDGILDCRRLLCSQLRLYLKETHNTDYNDHIPLIRKIITGIVPPQLTHDELRQLYNLFDKSVNAFDAVKPEDKSNTMYYPYIIYKILDLVISNGMRKKRILECIHLQSRDTLISNDNLWECICATLHDLEYRPTDRNDQKIDI